MSLDQRWYLDVNTVTRDTPWLHGAFAAYALWGGLVALALMLVAAYLVGRRRTAAALAVGTVVAIGIGTVAALLINQRVVSPDVQRVRPCHALQHVQVLLTCNTDYSFPSDHCVIAGAFVAGLAFVGWRWALPALGLALLLAFTRVYVGVHYPSDAAAGLGLGAVVDVLLVLALRRPLGRLAEWLAGTALRPLVTARR